MSSTKREFVENMTQPENHDAMGFGIFLRVFVWCRMDSGSILMTSHDSCAFLVYVMHNSHVPVSRAFVSTNLGAALLACCAPPRNSNQTKI